MRGTGFHAQCLGRRPMLTSGLIRPAARAVALCRAPQRTASVHVAAFATSGTTLVKIKTEHVTSSKQQLVVVGSWPELGSWHPSKGKMMKCDGSTWSAELSFPAGCSIEYKIVSLSEHSTCTWEPGVNRKLHVTGAPDMHTTIEAACTWGKVGEVVKRSCTPVMQQEALVTITPPAKSSGSGLVHCQVVVPLPGATPGNKVVMVGSVPQLGSWDPRKGLQLIAGPDQVCRGEVELPAGIKVEAKLVLMEATGSFKWEGGDNRTLSLPPPASSDTTYIMHMDYGMPANEYIAVMHQPEGAQVSLSGSSLRASCRFTVPPQHAPLSGQQLVLVGSAPELGLWDVARGLKLVQLPGGGWSASASLPVAREVELKLVVVESNGLATWEAGPNRKLRPAGTLTATGAGVIGVDTLITLAWGNPATNPTVCIPRYAAQPAAAPVAGNVGSAQGEAQALISLPSASVADLEEPAPVVQASSSVAAAGSPQGADGSGKEARAEEEKEGGRKEQHVLSTFLKLLVNTFTGAVSKEEILRVGQDVAAQAAAAVGTPAAQLQQMMAQVAALRAEVAPVQPGVQILEAAQADAVAVVPGAVVPAAQPAEQPAAHVEPTHACVTTPPDHASVDSNSSQLQATPAAASTAEPEPTIAMSTSEPVQASTEQTVAMADQTVVEPTVMAVQLEPPAVVEPEPAIPTDEPTAVPALTPAPELLPAVVAIHDIHDPTPPEPLSLPATGNAGSTLIDSQLQHVAPAMGAVDVAAATAPLAEPALTQKTDLEPEPEPAQPTVQVAVGASGPTRTGRSRSRARQGASSPRRTISPAPAGQPQLPADLAPYEAQVMAVLAMYPGLRLERLHAMMGASTLPPMYNKTPEQLGVLLTYLVTAGTLACEGGEYKLRGVEVPRPRKRSPSPRPPAAADTSSGRARGVSSKAKANTPAELDVSAYETQILATLGLHGALSLDHLHHLLTLSTVTPIFDKPISQLGTYVTRLVSQNKVSFANGLYTRGSATTTQKAQRSSEAAGSEAEAKPKARRSRGSCKARSPKAASPSDPQVSSEAVQASVLLSAAAETSSASAPAPELPEPAAAAPKAKRGSAKSSRSKAASPDAGEQTPEPTSEAAPMAAAKREGRKRSPRRTSPSKSPKPGDVVVPAAEAAAAGESSVVEAAAAGAAAAAAVRGVAAVTAEESAGCVPQVVAEDVGQAAPAVSPAAAERDMAEHEPHVLAIIQSYGAVPMDRLHAMMRATSAATGYCASESQLGSYLMQLVGQGKVSQEGGLIRHVGADEAAAAAGDDIVRSTKRRSPRSSSQSRPTHTATPRV